MESEPLSTAEIRYQRARFVASLPTDYRYSPTHAWIQRRPSGLWRVGLTRFGARMLGETVDHGFNAQPGQAVECGQIIGWVEGFKAISDLVCLVDGEFVGANTILQERVHLIHKDPHGHGWLYEAKGNPEPDSISAREYAALLDRTIDQIVEKPPE